MIYLLWGLLNIGLLILFICIFFKATRLVKERLGILVAIVFALGLLSFMGRSYQRKGKDRERGESAGTWKFYPADSLVMNSIVSVSIDLEKTLISKYQLHITYGKDKMLARNLPTTANAWVNGFQSGTSWEPLSIIVKPTEDNKKFEYQVNGTVKWSLLGMVIYSQFRQWKGFVPLN